MSGILRTQLWRAFHSSGFRFSLGMGMILVGWHYMQHVLPSVGHLELWRENPGQGFYPPSVFNRWIGLDFFSLQAFLLFFLVPVLAALPFSASLQEDLKTGAAKNILLRCSRRQYLLAKYLAVFLSAGTVVLILLLVSLAITAATLPSLPPVPSTFTFSVGANSMWSKLFYTAPYLYVAGYLALIFVFSGLLACVSLPSSGLTGGRLTVQFVPLLLYLFLYLLFDMLQMPWLSPLEFLRPAQMADNISFTAISVEALVLFAVPFGMFWYRGTRKDVF